MKKYTSTPTFVFTRPLLTLGLASVLSTLAVGAASAQDSSSTTLRTTTQTDPNTLNAAKPKVTATEADFLKTAAASNLAEIEMAKLALKKSDDPKIKEFAEQMVKDHGEANKNLEALDKRSNIPFNPEISKEDKITYGKLEELKGEEFNEAYVKNAVSDHKKDSSDYKSGMNKVADRDVLDYIKKFDPIIEQHLQMAHKLEKAETKS